MMVSTSTPTSAITLRVTRAVKVAGAGRVAGSGRERSRVEGVEAYGAAAEERALQVTQRLPGFVVDGSAEDGKQRVQRVVRRHLMRVIRVIRVIRVMRVMRVIRVIRCGLRGGGEVGGEGE